MHQATQITVISSGRSSCNVTLKHEAEQLWLKQTLSSNDSSQVLGRSYYRASHTQKGGLPSALAGTHFPLLETALDSRTFAMSPDCTLL